MSKEGKQVNFDLSTLTLQELIQVYEDINSFLVFLEDSKLIKEEEVEDEN